MKEFWTSFTSSKMANAPKRFAGGGGSFTSSGEILALLQSLYLILI